MYINTPYIGIQITKKINFKFNTILLYTIPYYIARFLYLGISDKENFSSLLYIIYKL